EAELLASTMTSLLWLIMVLPLVGAGLVGAGGARWRSRASIFVPGALALLVGVVGVWLVLRGPAAGTPKGPAPTALLIGALRVELELEPGRLTLALALVGAVLA